MNMLLLLILVPFIGSALIQFGRFFSRRLHGAIAITTISITFILCVLVLISRPSNSALVHSAFASAGSTGIPLVVDGLSALFLLPLNFIALMVGIFSFPYMAKFSYKNIYWSLFLVLIGSLNAIVMNGDLFNLYIFLEVSCIASAALVAFGVREKGLEAGLKYLVMSLMASVIFVLGLALAYWYAGSLNMSMVSIALRSCDPSTRTLIITLLLFGAVSKSSLFPFLAWLPDAHQCAPAPISAFLSGVLIKASGVYLIIRLCYNVFGMTAPISNVLLVLGTLSIIAGSFLAIGQNDMKRLFGFSSVSQIGYIILGLGLASPMGVMGALLHLLNHAVFKPLLFLNAGAIENLYGTRDLNKLGGIAKTSPILAITSLIGSLSISGIPPFNGFWSKAFIILACVQTGHIGLAFIAVLGSALTLAYMLKVQKKAFWGPSPSNNSAHISVPLGMNIPMVTLAALCILGGIFYGVVVIFAIGPAVITIAQGINYAALSVGGIQ
jgi:multicomponent Na+:H+ antiporter subunit D